MASHHTNFYIIRNTTTRQQKPEDSWVLEKQRNLDLNNDETASLMEDNEQTGFDGIRYSTSHATTIDSQIFYEFHEDDIPCDCSKHDLSWSYRAMATANDSKTGMR